MQRRNDIGVLRNPGDEDAGKPGKRDRHRGDRAGLDHHEQRPAVEEAPEWGIRFPQVDVLPARARHHRGKLAVGQSSGDRQQSGDQPCDQQPAGASELARHCRGDDEDPRADHRARHHHRGVEQAEAALEFGVEGDDFGAGAGSRCSHQRSFYRPQASGLRDQSDLE